ncbi:DUF2934 domain-containing protein, partial [Methylobacterium sp. Leaf118]|uniref:DUF2934 domain-containing protein n=1 Tax=Methylobacterium sp. Leaf118 TaxID=2876562 RepID=UPI001E2C72D4
MQLCEHQVRERAYSIWEDEGRGFGRAEAHWLQAEAELGRAASAAPLAIETRVAAAPAALAPVAKPRAARA